MTRRPPTASAPSADTLAAGVGQAVAGLPPGTSVDLDRLSIELQPGAGVREVAEAVRAALLEENR